MKLSDKDRKFLKKYDSGKYEKPSVTVDILVFTVDINGRLELLMIKRKKPPYCDCWAIPGGFVNINESLDSACERELFEETHISGIHFEQLYTFGDVDRDPRTRVISVAYMALVPKDMLNVAAGDDAKEAKWFEVSLSDKLIFTPEIETAFDHDKIIKLALERLRSKLEYTNIAFNLLSDKNRFTIYELQKINEVILGRKLDTANFRRDFIKKYLKTGFAEETGEECRERTGRASKYYRLLTEVTE